MSIRCVCQNGHVLKVKQSLAGTSGLCPICRGRVTVPELPKRAMSEDAILDLLGSKKPSAATASGHTDPALSGSQSGIELKKMCERCNREISAGSHICPICHTYIANLGDF